MKVLFSTIHSMRPALEVRVASHSFYKGLSFGFIVWRTGRQVTFTTKKIYAAYLEDVKERAKRHQQELRDKEEQLALEIAHDGN